MGRVREAGKTVTDVSILIACLLLLPISAPIIMSKNKYGYANKLAGLPGIQNGGGVVSGIAAFAYVIVGVSMIGGVAVAAGGGVDFSSTADNETINESMTKTSEPTTMSSPNHPSPKETPTEPETATETSAPTTTPAPTATDTLTPITANTQTPTDTPTPADTATQTPAPTVTDSAVSSFTDLSEEELGLRRSRYRWYMAAYRNITETANDATVANTTVDAANETATFVYILNNPENGTRNSNLAIALMTHYAGFNEEIRTGDNENSDSRWIPKELEFRALTPDGELHHTSNISFMRAWRHNQGTTSGVAYVLTYYYNQEYGPAHHRYEENQTATPNSIDRTAP